MYDEGKVEPGKPEQFCVLVHGVEEERYPGLGLTPYPMAWRLEIVDGEKPRGFEYVR